MSSHARTRGSGSPGDEQLVCLAVTGDKGALESLVIRHQARVYGLARRLVRRTTDAEEITQETFLRAIRRLHTFRGDARFSTWLFQIATNVAREHGRRQARREAATLESYLPRFDRHGRHAFEIEDGGGKQVDEIVEQRRDVQRAVALLERLPERYRVPFVLRDLEEMPTSEVASVLGISEVTVRQRVHRARLMLRGYFARGKEKSR